MILIDGILYGFRDPLGIKPFCIGRTENGYMIASESVAVDALNAKFSGMSGPGNLSGLMRGDPVHEIAVAGNGHTASSSTFILPGPML